MKQVSLSAKIYADALVKFYTEGNKDIEKKLDIVREICANSPDLVNVLLNPAISQASKFSLIEEVFAKDLDKQFIDFIKILVEKNRFNELEGISIAFKDVIDKLNNIQNVEIISAIDLTEEKKSVIKEKLQNKFQKEIITQWTVDTDIIGGLVIKFDDNIIDNSLKNKLEKLSKI